MSCDLESIMDSLMFLNMRTSFLPSGLKYERHQYNLYGQLHRKEYYYDDSSLKHSDELFDTEGSMYCKRYFKTKPNSKINGVEIYRNKNFIRPLKMINY